jgi:hypothetical protein
MAWCIRRPAAVYHIPVSSAMCARRSGHIYRKAVFGHFHNQDINFASGSVLSCFLGRDGGPREGAIRLLPEKIYVHPPISEEGSTPMSATFEGSGGRVGFVKKVSQKVSGYLAKRVHDAHHTNGDPVSPSLRSAVPLVSPGTQLERTRTFSRTSRANGSAYGYTGGYRNRLASNATVNARRGSMTSSLRRRRGSNYDGVRETGGEGADLNFAQRLLMANENAVTNIADLWVAAAMNVDNEDPFESDSDVGSDEETEDMDLGQILNEHDGEDNPDAMNSHGQRASSNRNITLIPHLSRSRRTSNVTGYGTPRRPSYLQQSPMRHPSTSFSQPMDGTPTSRRFSSTVPSIFAHPGVKTPSAVLDAQQLLVQTENDPSPGGDILDPIFESRPTSHADDVESLAEKPPSLTSQLPILIIVQYGMLALHTTTHDQVFMSYLVSWVKVNHFYRHLLLIRYLDLMKREG